VEIHAYEHPVKRGARRVVRQLFLFWGFGAVAIMIFMSYGSHPDPSLAWAVPGLIFGWIPGCLAWALYRLLRFAFRSQS